MKSNIRAYIKPLDSVAEEGLSVIDWLLSKKLNVIHYELSDDKEKSQEALFRLLSDAMHKDTLLINDINHLISIPNDIWDGLLDIIIKKEILILMPSIEPTHIAINAHKLTPNSPELGLPTHIILSIIKELRRKKDEHKANIANGIKKANEQGRFSGRKPDVELYGRINDMIASGSTYVEVIAELGCSSTTVARAIKYRKSAAG